MSTDTSGFVHPEFLVSTAWLAAHIDDPDVVVLDGTVHLRPNPPGPYTVVSGRADYEAGHILGAQFADLQADLSDNSQSLRFMTPSAAQFAAAMGRFGVGPKTKVVLYSTANAWWATRIWWLLRVFGFDNAALLDGGWRKWTLEGRAIATGAAVARAAQVFVAQPRAGLMVDQAAVAAAIGDQAVCTLNALLPQQHAGEGSSPYGRPGRIKGSVNVPAASLFDPVDNTLLPAATLRARFGAIGALDKRVIVYCGGGIAASADALALTMLGHTNVALYDASLSEWASSADLPMETG